MFVGAGRLATQFAKALHRKGHTIEAVYSRTMENAQALCSAVGGFPADNIAQLPLYADAYIIAVKDSALSDVIAQLTPGREDRPMYHTAGSMPMSVFGSLRHHGVIYPMQTFSKERDADFTHLPIFIEASTDLAQHVATALATSVSDNVRQLSTDDRRHLHLAAVFACNFANHCYALAADILERHGMSYDVLLPLIEETAQKVQCMHPLDAQTGPAVRYDENVIRAQSELLTNQPLMQKVYETMSHSIHHSAQERATEDPISPQSHIER